jgi:hypothetical protein
MIVSRAVKSHLTRRPIVRHTLAISAITVVLGTAATVRAQDIESGPRVGTFLPGPFSPLNVATGRKEDFLDEFGSKPVVMVFARTVDANLTALIKQLDQRVAKENKEGIPLRAAVIVTSEDDVKKVLNELRTNEKIKNVILALDNPAGPQSYKLSKEAEVTALLFVRKGILANRAYKKTSFNEKSVAAILNDISKILPTRQQP